MVSVRGVLPAADCDDLVFGGYQARDEISAHMTRCADDDLAHRTYDACMPEPESPSKVSAAAPVASGRGHVGLRPRMADVATVAGVSHQTTLDPGDLAGSLPCPRDSHRKG